MPTTNQNVNIVINAKDKTKSAFAGLKNNLLGVAAALAALKVGFDILSDIVEVGAESERQWLAVAGALKRHNIEVTSGLTEIRKFADEMQTLTGVSDEIVAKGIQKFIDFGASISEAKEEMRVATDLAVGSGISLSSAVDLISKAQVGYTSTLSRYGIIIDEAIPKNEKFAAAIEQITQKFGGAAQDVAKSFSVQMKVLGERFGDLKEDIFRLLLPALASVLTIFIETVNIGKSVILFFGDLLGAVSALGAPVDETGKELKEASANTKIWTERLDDLIGQLDTGLISIREFRFQLTQIAGPIISTVDLVKASLELGHLTDNTFVAIGAIEQLGETSAEAYARIQNEGNLAAFAAEAYNQKIEEMQRSTQSVTVDFKALEKAFGDTSLKVVEEGVPAWKLLEETMTELELEMAELALISQEQTQMMIDDWLEKWQMLQDVTLEIFDTITQTLITNTNDMAKNIKKTFEDIGQSIVRSLVKTAVAALFTWIATTVIGKKKEDELTASTMALAGANVAAAVSAATATAAFIAEAIAAQALADAIWSAVAAQAALSVGATVGPALAAASAIKGGKEALGFDNPINDAFARRNGEDFGREFMSGLTNALGAPGFGQTVSNVISDAISPSTTNGSGGITINFSGPVTDEGFVRDVIVPAIEQATLDGFGRFNIDDQNVTGGSPIAFA